MTSVSTLMTRDRLVTLGPDVSVSDAARTLANAGLSHLLVTEEGEKLLGVFCICDLDRAATGTPLRAHLHDVPVTIDLHADADDALRVMSQRHVHCLPVLDEGRLRGVITLHDLRRNGLAGAEEEHCSCCGSTEHVRCNHGRDVGLCFDCTRQSEPPNLELGLDAELGGGD
jgi:predicted transcriptional regulator